MDSTSEAGAISEILKIKSQIDQNIAELQEERASLRHKIQGIQSDKENVRREKGKEFQKQYMLKIKLADTRNDLDKLVMSVDQVRSMLQKSEESIWSTVGSASFIESFANIRASIVGAINYYSDDSLKLELLKQTDINREKRVELTRLMTEIETKQNELEAARKEKERLRQAELERERHELEQKQRLEEERILAEKDRQREEFLKQKLVPLENSIAISKSNSFRTVSFHACSPEPDSRPIYSSSAGISSLSGHDPDSSTYIDLNDSKPTNGLPPLSQFTRW